MRNIAGHAIENTKVINLNDFINGTFEMLGGLMIWMDVWELFKSKRIQGVYWLSRVVFTLWGIWNLYYYPSLGQWFSFFGGLNIVIGNTAWVFLMVKYWKK